MHAELPVGAFLAAALVLVPLPWHWRARNVPTISFIIWLFVSNVIFGINALIWAGNVNIVVPVWCDIVTKVQMGSNMGLPACCLCLCIHLERIASVRQVRTTLTQKYRRMIFDCAMCWGLPAIYMALHYIVQGHRFDIVEDFGCRPTTYVSLPAIFLIWVLPLIVVVLTLTFAGLALVHFFRRRIMFSHHLQNSNSALTTSRYLRLMLMAIVQMFWATFVTTVNMWFTCRSGLRPWTGWADVHVGFSRVGLFPTLLIPEFTLRWTYFLWWTVPITSVLFFAFFSFGEDAMKEYRACFAWIRRIVFRQKSLETVDSSGYSSFARAPAPRATLPKFSTLSTSSSTPNDSKSEFSRSETDVSPSNTSPNQRPGSLDKFTSFIMTPSSDTTFDTSPTTETSFIVSTIPSNASILPPYSQQAADMA